MDIPVFKDKKQSGNFYKDKTFVNDLIYRILQTEHPINITNFYLEISRTHQVSETAIRKLIKQWLPQFPKARIDEDSDWLLFDNKKKEKNIEGDGKK